MLLAVILVGIVLITVAVKGTQGELFGALKEDIPAFAIWGGAILALGVIGFVPGLKPVSRGFLALLLLVIVVNNYDKIISGFSTGLKGGGGNSSGQGSGGNSGGGSSGSSLLDQLNELGNSTTLNGALSALGKMF